MKDFTLKIRYQKNSDGIAADPQPDWSFDAILLELNSLENRLKVSLQISSPPSKTDAAVLKWKAKNESPGPFVMQVPDDEFGVDMDNVEEGHHNHRAMVAGMRFGCDELSISDSEDSDDESVFGMQRSLMPHVGLAEGALSELTHEHELGVMEVARNQIMELETCLIDENEKFASTIACVENYTKTRQELDRKFDMQYQRRISIG